MRWIAVVAVSICLILPWLICTILALLGKGRGLYLKPFRYRCTNLKESNIKEQKYVQRMNGLCALIEGIFVLPGIYCYIYEQWIAGAVLLALGLVNVAVFALIMKYNKKFQSCYAEISDDKRSQEYFESLKNRTNTDNASEDIKINSVADDNI